MEKEFVPYALALELKELGFDEECFRCVVIGMEHLVYTPTDYEDFPEQKEKEVLLPLFQQAFRWFRDKHNVEVKPMIVIQGSDKYYNLSIVKPLEDSFIITNEYKKFNTYEEAELECLRQLINLTKGESR